jgi:hypothetical protein
MNTRPNSASHSATKTKDKTAADGSPLSKALKPSPPKGRNLAQQQADFTAEGSPPPGQVASQPPETRDRPGEGPAPPRASSGSR